MSKIPGGAFDGSDYQPDTIIPEGVYPAVYCWGEFKKNKANTGDYLMFKYRIIAGDYKNSEIFDGLNYTHSGSETAEIIGKKTLEEMRKASRLTGEFTDTNQLQNKPVMITIGVAPPRGGWPEKNVITRFEKYTGSVDEKTIPSYPEQQEDSQKKDSIPPWVKQAEPLKEDEIPY